MSFIEIFAPGMRHLREERERQRHDVVHPKQGGPPFGVDLEAGTARFTMPATNPDSRDQTDAQTDAQTEDRTDDRTDGEPPAT